MESVHEEWRVIPGYPNYEVSDLGRVRSIDRQVRTARNPNMTFIRRGKLLKPISNRGYLVVKLGGPDKAFGIHQAVALAFIGQRPESHVVNHKSGIKTDNRPENLEYTTNKRNVLHAYENGLLSNKGSTNGRAVLTEKDVQKILEMPNETTEVLAEKFHCKPYVIQKLRRGGSWKHVHQKQKEAIS